MLQYIYNILQCIYIYVYIYYVTVLYVRVYIICYRHVIPGLKSAGSLSARSVKQRWKRKKYLKFKLLNKTTVSPEDKKHLISTSVIWEKYRLKIFINEHRPLVFWDSKSSGLGFQERNIPLKIALCDFSLAFIYKLNEIWQKNQWMYNSEGI